MYFNFSNNAIVEDAPSLQNKIDNLTKANETLEKQTTGLRHEIRKVESKIDCKNSKIHALKEQIRFYKQQCSDSIRRKNKNLKKDICYLCFTD